MVYCGATRIVDESDLSSYDESDIRQIEAVTKILGNELGMCVAKFTSEENIEQRTLIKEHFQNGTLQAIVAIKCLDEGVNIPAIQHAFILASSTDPKEFIQRRGRVLRLYNNKEYAYIHDFVTIPCTDEAIGSSLVESELKRVYEFNSLAENSQNGEEFIDDLLYRFNIEKEKIVDARDKYNIGGMIDEE